VGWCWRAWPEVPRRGRARRVEWWRRPNAFHFAQRRLVQRRRTAAEPAASRRANGGEIGRCAALVHRFGTAGERHRQVEEEEQRPTPASRAVPLAAANGVRRNVPSLATTITVARWPHVDAERRSVCKEQETPNWNTAGWQLGRPGYTLRISLSKTYAERGGQ
jgi:hypothetical protein